MYNSNSNFQIGSGSGEPLFFIFMLAIIYDTHNSLISCEIFRILISPRYKPHVQIENKERLT